MHYLTLSENDWRQRLSAEQYHVLREGGTEPAFGGRYHNNDAGGVYRCAGCATPLFASADKYDSGAGWPSFTRPIFADRVTEHADVIRGVTHTEIRCTHCDGHLGHAVPDGPPPDGTRYCINSLSLDFRARIDAE